MNHQFKRNALNRWGTLIQKVAHALKQRLLCDALFQYSTINEYR